MNLLLSDAFHINLDLRYIFIISDILQFRKYTGQMSFHIFKKDTFYL